MPDHPTIAPLHERIKAARQAIRAGINPETALYLALHPPATPEEAQRILAQAHAYDLRAA